MSEPPVIDPEAIATLRSLCTEEDESFLKEVVDIFLVDTPQRLEELHSCLADGDTPRFVRAAHTVKGSASNLGAARMRALAEEIEHTAKKSGLAGLDTKVASLEQEFIHAQTELKKLLT